MAYTVRQLEEELGIELDAMLRSKAQTVEGFEREAERGEGDLAESARQIVEGSPSPFDLRAFADRVERERDDLVVGSVEPTYRVLVSEPGQSPDEGVAALTLLSYLEPEDLSETLAPDPSLEDVLLAATSDED